MYLRIKVFFYFIYWLAWLRTQLFQILAKPYYLVDNLGQAKDSRVNPEKKADKDKYLTLG